MSIAAMSACIMLLSMPKRLTDASSEMLCPLVPHNEPLPLRPCCLLLPAVEDLPHDDQGRLLRPGVVWFNENLDDHVLASIQQVLEETGLLLIVGTSVVYPAAGYAPQVAGRGGEVATQPDMQHRHTTPAAPPWAVGSVYAVLSTVHPCILPRRCMLNQIAPQVQWKTPHRGVCGRLALTSMQMWARILLVGVVPAPDT